MASVLVTAIIMLSAIGFAVIIARMTRNQTNASPRRREFNRARAERAIAATTIHEISETLDRYQDTLDSVGESLRFDVRQLIRGYDQKMLETDK